jgi:hypothetical protein
LSNIENCLSLAQVVKRIPMPSSTAALATLITNSDAAASSASSASSGLLSPTSTGAGAARTVDIIRFYNEVFVRRLKSFIFEQVKPLLAGYACIFLMIAFFQRCACSHHLRYMYMCLHVSPPRQIPIVRAALALAARLLVAAVLRVAQLGRVRVGSVGVCLQTRGGPEGEPGHSIV